MKHALISLFVLAVSASVLGDTFSTGAATNVVPGKLSVTGQITTHNVPVATSLYEPILGTTNSVASYGALVVLHTNGNCCTDFAAGAGWDNETWIQTDAGHAIRQNGDITGIRFSWGNPTNTTTLTNVVFQIYRPLPNTDGGSGIALRLVGSSPNLLPSLTNGAINTISFASPIPALIGDFYGFSVTGNAAFNVAGANDTFFYDTVTGATVVVFVGPTYLPPTATGWTTSNASIPVDVIMSTAPQFITIGDSLILGTGGDGSSIGSFINERTGWTYQNMGVGFDTTDNILGRFSQDVLAHHPKFVVINGGVNDIFTGGTLTNFQSNWRAILSLCQTNGIIPIALLMTPYTGGNSLYGQKIDLWNSWLNGLCETYGGATVDARPWVGQFRSGGDAYNLWDIRPEYASGEDSLGVHFNAEGYRQIAQAVLQRMNLVSETGIIKRSAIVSLQFLNQTNSISTQKLQSRVPWPNARPSICEPGMYQISVYIAVVTPGSGASVTGTLGWNDPVASYGTLRSISTSTLDASSTNFLQQSFTIQLGSTFQGPNEPNITFATTLTNAATYSTWIAAQKIN